MGSQCKARRRCLAGCQARSRNAAMGAQWPEPSGLRPNGPATALRSLPRALAIGRVARLVAEPFGHNAIPRRECQQTLPKAMRPLHKLIGFEFVRADAADRVESLLAEGCDLFHYAGHTEI